MPKSKNSTRKVYYGNQLQPKDWIKAIAAIGGFCLLVFLVIHATNSQAIPPATADEVAAAIENQGYEAIDTTAQWYEPGSTLEAGVGVFQDDVRIYYYVFGSDKRALNVMQQYRGYILEHRYKVHSVETEDAMANFTIYTIAFDDEFTACARVENTVFYAESNAKHSKDILSIMNAIGYNYDLF